VSPEANIMFVGAFFMYGPAIISLRVLFTPLLRTPPPTVCTVPCTSTYVPTCWYFRCGCFWDREYGKYRTQYIRTVGHPLSHPLQLYLYSVEYHTVFPKKRQNASTLHWSKHTYKIWYRWFWAWRLANEAKHVDQGKKESSVMQMVTRSDTVSVFCMYAVTSETIVAGKDRMNMNSTKQAVGIWYLTLPYMIRTRKWTRRKVRSKFWWWGEAGTDWRICSRVSRVYWMFLLLLLCLCLCLT